MTTLDRPFTAALSLLKTLTEINLQDMRTSLGLDSFPFGRKALDAVGWIPAQRFARQVIAFDHHALDEEVPPFIAPENLVSAPTGSLVTLLVRIIAEREKPID